MAAPVRVTWESRLLPQSASGYAVFVDKAPIHPRQSLRAVAKGDESCLHTRGCPDAAYLRAHDVFLTTATTVTIPYFATLPGAERHDRRPIHEVTVVLVDRSGYRVGEYAYSVQFRLPETAA